MVKQNQTLLRMKGWAGGLNTEDDQFLLEPNEAPVLSNMDVGLRGELTKRKGYSKWSTSDPAAMNRGEDLWFYHDGSNPFFIYRDSTNGVYHVNNNAGTVFTRSTISGPVNVAVDDQCGAIVMNDTFYITGLTTPASAYKFDGTTWTEITDNTLDGSGTEFPLATVLHVRGDLVFAGGLTTKTSRVQWSSPILPETWPTNNFVDVNPDDGGKVYGLITYKDVLLIFKNNAIWSLAGTDADTFTLFSVSESFGTISARTIVVFGDKVIWFDPLNGVMSYDGSDVEPIDEKINSRILDNADLTTAVRTIRAFGFQERYYLSMDLTAGGRRTYVFDTRSKAWSEYDFGSMGTAVKTAESSDLYGTQTTDEAKGVFKLFDTENDNGATVSSEFVTTWISPDEGPIQEHRLLKIILYSQPTTSGSTNNITIQLRRDYNPKINIESTTMDVNDVNLDQIQTSIIHFEDHTGRVFQIRLTHANASETWQINAIDFLFLDRPVSSGKNV